MKVNRRISASARKMKELGLDNLDIANLTRKAYPCPNPLLGVRRELESTLKRFHIISNPKRVVYGENPQDSLDYAEFSEEELPGFAKRTLYAVVFNH